MPAANDIDELIRQVNANEVPGGSLYGRTVATIIEDRVAARRGEPWSVAADELERVTAWAVQTKPSMASVHNVVAIARRAFATAPHGDADAAVEAVTTALQRFRRASEQAIDRLADFAVELVPTGGTVLFHSNSGSLARVLHRIATQVDDSAFRFTESRPYRESRELVKVLAGTDAALTLYSDAAIGVAAAGADLALVGADAVYRDGSVVNKVGTLLVALACKHHGIPVYVATELSKVYLGDPADVTMEVRPGGELAEGWEPASSGRVAVWNQFFEPTPPDLIAGYVTERGVVAPADMAAAAAEALVQ